jgi:pentatricopeptide repeat protein
MMSTALWPPNTVRAIAQDMLAYRVQPNAITANLLLKAYRHNGLWQGVWLLSMRTLLTIARPNCNACRWKCWPRMQYWWSLASVLTPLHPRQASDLVIRLSDLGLELDEASFTIAIVACNKARQYDTSLRLYQRMKDTVGEPQHPTAKEHGALACRPGYQLGVCLSTSRASQ